MLSLASPEVSRPKLSPQISLYLGCGRMILPTLTVSPSINLVKKTFHRYVLRLVSWVMLDYIKLLVNVNITEGRVWKLVSTLSSHCLFCFQQMPIHITPMGVKWHQQM